MPSNKLKYKIISCSSEQSDYPASSLLFPGSDGWQSRRFCTYPQEITLEFTGVTHVDKLELVSDHRLISSQIDILHYAPSANANQDRFYKYGYLQFLRNENSNAREQKFVTVDINCLYLRLLIHKPYPTRDNFFSQVGLYQFSVYGKEEPTNLKLLSRVNESAEEGEDNFVGEKIAELKAIKAEAIQAEDYDRANICKQALIELQKLDNKLQLLQQRKAQAIEHEDFEQAKQIRDNIQRQKNQINSILHDLFADDDDDANYRQNNIDEDEDNRAYLQDNQFVQNHSNFLQNNSAKKSIGNENQQSRVSKLSKLSRVRRNSNRWQKPQQMYDDRVVPAALKNIVKTDQPELQQTPPDNDKTEQLPEIEEIDGKFVKDASVMSEYFDPETVKKYFSKHWKHKANSLHTIQSQLGSKPKDFGLLRCLITVVKHSLNQTNFQVSQGSLSLLQRTLQLNKQLNLPGKHPQLQHDLEDIAKEIVKKLADNNAKTRTAAEGIFLSMVQNSLYGVDFCCAVLVKSKGKLSVRQCVSRLSYLTRIVEKYGVSGYNASQMSHNGSQMGENGAPMAVIDYAISQLNNPDLDVRNGAITLLAIANRKDSQKIAAKLLGLKKTVITQINEKSGNWASPKKGERSVSKKH